MPSFLLEVLFSQCPNEPVLGLPVSSFSIILKKPSYGLDAEAEHNALLAIGACTTLMPTLLLVTFFHFVVCLMTSVLLYWLEVLPSIIARSIAALSLTNLFATISLVTYLHVSHILGNYVVQDSFAMLTAPFDWALFGVVLFIVIVICVSFVIRFQWLRARSFVAVCSSLLVFIIILAISTTVDIELRATVNVKL